MVAVARRWSSRCLIVGGRVLRSGGAAQCVAERASSLRLALRVRAAFCAQTAQLAVGSGDVDRLGPGAARQQRLARMQVGRVTTHLPAKYTIGADFRLEAPGQSSVGLIGGGRGHWLGGTMASAVHEPIMGVWGHNPQRGPGAELLVRG